MAVEHGPLSLHVPEPAFRPGDTPDYSTITVAPPGTFRRPPVDTPSEDMRELAYGIMRVLDDDGNAAGNWDPELSDDELIDGLRQMERVREFDRRMLTQQRQGKTSFYMQALGEEAIACGFQAELAKGDMNFPTYRQQGLLLTAGYSVVDMMCQIYSNEKDPLLGRQLPIMYSSKEYGFFSISGNLATQFVQAVGWAMGSAIKGDTAIAAGWIGDGSTAESDFHSALVFASTYNAPVVLNIVNNQWAISTHSSIALGKSPTFASRGHGFGIASLRVDGNDYLAVRAASRWAVERARSNAGPTMIEWVTYRAGSHSTSDDPGKYRPKDAGSFWPLGDPVERLKAHVIGRGIWDDDKHDDLLAEIRAEMQEHQEHAESHGTLHEGPKPSRDIFEGVFETMPPHLEAQRREAGL